MSESKLHKEPSHESKPDSEPKLSKDNFDQTDKLSNEIEKTDNLKDKNDSLPKTKNGVKGNYADKKNSGQGNSDGFEEEFDEDRLETKPEQKKQRGDFDEDMIADEFHDEPEPVNVPTEQQLPPKNDEEKFGETDEFDQIETTDHKKVKIAESKKNPTIQKKVQQPRRLSFEASNKPGFSLNGLVLSHMDEYNGLRDDNLQLFFSQVNRKKILVKNGLITEDGYIVKKPEEYLKKKVMYLKSKDQGEESSHVRAKTFEKKKINPYKENVIIKRNPSKGKTAKNQPKPKTNADASKISQKTTVQ
jgi:hypothetical protein